MRVGDLIYATFYSPGSGKSRIYKPRHLMKLAGVVPSYCGPDITRWWLVNPERPNDETRMSWVESDWADLEPAIEELGMLF